MDIIAVAGYVSAIVTIFGGICKLISMINKISKDIDRFNEQLDKNTLYIIDEQDYEAFGYMYQAYHDVDGKLVFDKNKSTEVYEGNVIEPTPTIEDLMAQIAALNKRINELTNDANNV